MKNPLRHTQKLKGMTPEQIERLLKVVADAETLGVDLFRRGKTEDAIPLVIVKRVPVEI